MDFKLVTQSQLENLQRIKLWPGNKEIIDPHGVNAQMVTKA